MSETFQGCVPLLRVTRSGVQDNLHRGAVVVVDDEGNDLMSFGDPDTQAYIRSAAKPIQALPMMLSGAPEAFGFDDADIAIICGSHQGGEAQVRQVRSILSKAAVTEVYLKSGEGIADNCSGKHAGMLSTCKLQGLDLASYLQPDHPHQVKIRETIGTVCGIRPAQIRLGIDGCGAPIHYMSVRNMALGYARMSRPEKHFDAKFADAVKRITRAMTANAGGHTGEPDYAGVLGDARLLTKVGGNGGYCAAVIGKGIGFAMKVEDGSTLPTKPVFIEVMRRMGVISDAESASLAGKFNPPVTNRRGAVIGEIELLF